MYSYRKRMRGMSEGIRHEHLDSVFVFRASLEMLLMLIRDPPMCFEKPCNRTKQDNPLIYQSKKLNVNSDPSTDTRVLPSCAKCKIAKYYCKEHQESDWIRGHKKTCTHLSVLKQLLGLEQRPLEGHINFHFEVENETVSQKQQTCSVKHPRLNSCFTMVLCPFPLSQCRAHLSVF